MTLQLENRMPIQDSKRSPRRPPRGIARGPGRAETPEERRERIARMAWPLFLKKGYDNVSIDEIIGVVGGSKATIYAWFGGKEGLFEAVVRQKCLDVVRQPGSAADRNRSLVPCDGAVAADSRIPSAHGVDRTDIPRHGTAFLQDRA